MPSCLSPGRRMVHRRATRVLAAGGHSPLFVADRLLEEDETDTDLALVTGLHEAVAATCVSKPSAWRAR